METVADFKNNPRAPHLAPYNDGSLHYVDMQGRLLIIGFPAVLDMDGKYSRTGPYFNMAGAQGLKVCWL